ncbi:MAG: hypothetical protein JWP70_1602 [Leifsonia sp.]|jgi:hypothetical protein|nr:hypothetical protein [Leifsonia sp.]MDQ1587347.1 hypothetical protein [Microbacteriaceae bacterium]
MDQNGARRVPEKRGGHKKRADPKIDSYAWSWTEDERLVVPVLALVPPVVELVHETLLGSAALL